LSLLKAQNVYIPDANFKAVLVNNPSINTNGDTEIQVSEASSFSGMLIASGINISDMTGIEAFTSLNTLLCGWNALASLNLSANTGLTQLDCSGNQLTSLDVSANTALFQLACNDNQLTSLNLPNSSALVNLYCYSNQLTSLDVSTKWNLNTLCCQNNQLTNLSLPPYANFSIFYCSNNLISNLNIQNGHNNSLQNFDASGNPNLTCIQVDNVAFMNTTWGNAKDISASYSANCNPLTNCYAHFTMSPDTIPQTWYALNQCTGNGTINYVWNWGDGTPNDSTPNPSHTYATAGYYNICVSIADSAGCTNSYCDSSVYINKSSANAVINVSVVNQLPSYIITGLENPASSNFSIYPNPTSNILKIESTKNSNSNVKIYDAIGQLYLNEKLTNQNTSLNIQHLQSGIYFIKVDNNVQKFVKE
jgi:hypothetical protein